MEYLQIVDDGSLADPETDTDTPRAAPAGTVHVSEPPAARPARAPRTVKAPKPQDAADDAAMLSPRRKTD